MSRTRAEASFLCVLALSIGCALACSSSDDGRGGDDGGDGGGDGDGEAVDAAAPDAPPPPVCPDGVDVSFSSDVQPIFTASCTDTACHDAVGSAAQLDLTEGNAFGSLVGVTAFQCDRTLVVADDLDESYLVSKLTGIDMCSGTLMPKAGMALPDDELQLILGWICAGASP